MKIKRLKDTILEYVVLNMKRTFEDLDAIPILPRLLFSEILLKSMDMCWEIKHEELMPCIAARDKLQWDEASILKYVDQLHADDLQTFSPESIKKTKTLGVYLHPEEMPSTSIFKEISNASESLEDLKLALKRMEAYLFDASWMRVLPDVGQADTLALKRLSLDTYPFYLFPFALDPNKLMVLELRNTSVVYPLMQALPTFKQLVHLSMNGMAYLQYTLVDFVEAAMALKELRILDLHSDDQKVTAETLNKILANFEKLEILELVHVVLGPSDKVIPPPRRKLKVFNVLSVKSALDNGWMEPTVELLASTDSFGTKKSFKGLISTVSTTTNLHRYQDAFGLVCTYLGCRLVAVKDLVRSEENGTLDFRAARDVRHRARPHGSPYDLMTRMTSFAYSTGFKKFVDSVAIKFYNTYIKDYRGTYLGRCVRDKLFPPEDQARGAAIMAFLRQPI